MRVENLVFFIKDSIFRRVQTILIDSSDSKPKKSIAKIRKDNVRRLASFACTSNTAHSQYNKVIQTHVSSTLKDLTNLTGGLILVGFIGYNIRT